MQIKKKINFLIFTNYKNTHYEKTIYFIKTYFENAKLKIYTNPQKNFMVNIW